MPHEADIQAPRTILGRLLDRLESWGRHRELGHLPPGELDRLAHDIGLNGGELQRLAAVEPDAARLLYARLADLGFDMPAIEASGLGARRDMERTCGLCADRPLCAHDLEERPDSFEWRRVCPNNAVFEAMERLTAEAAGSR